MFLSSFGFRRLAAWCAIIGTAAFSHVCSAEMTTTLVSVRPDGQPAEAGHDYPSISGDGRCVAWMSWSPDIVAGANNGLAQFYRRDLQTSTTTRVSVSSAGVQQNDTPYYFFWPAISYDGARVAFSSMATNLVPDSANWIDVFMRDVSAGTTQRISNNSAGVQANRDSDSPVISGSGRYVAFTSRSFNLAPGTQDNRLNVYLRDTLTNTTVRASVADSGAQPNDDCDTPAVNYDGSLVAWCSAATNLVTGHTDSIIDVFMRNMLTGRTTCISVDPSGKSGTSTSSQPVFAKGGRYLAFASAAPNLMPGGAYAGFQVLRYDLIDHTMGLVSVSGTGAPADYGAMEPAISDDGRYVAFTSSATNLVPNDTNSAEDYFVRDTVAGTSTRVSVGADGSQANNGIWRASMSGDGQHFVFASESTNLVPGGTTGRHIFLRAPAVAVPFAVSEAVKASSIFAGLNSATAADKSRLDVVKTGASAGVVDLLDANLIARKASRLEPNP